MVRLPPVRPLQRTLFIGLQATFAPAAIILLLYVQCLLLGWCLIRRKSAARCIWWKRNLKPCKTLTIPLVCYNHRWWPAACLTSFLVALGTILSAYIFPLSESEYDGVIVGLDKKVDELLKEAKEAAEADRNSGKLSDTMARLAYGDETTQTVSTHVADHLRGSAPEDYEALKKFVFGEFGFGCIVIGSDGVMPDSLAAKAWCYQLAACIEDGGVPVRLLDVHESMVHSGEVDPEPSRREDSSFDIVGYMARAKGWHLVYDVDLDEAFWVR